MSEAENPSGTIHEVHGLKRIVMTLAGALIRTWQASLHYCISMDFDPEEVKGEPGALILLWHNRLFLGIGALKQSVLGQRKLHALVSASRDGGQLTHFIESLGIQPIRGSSSRRGATATRELFKALSNGHNVAITVDGPRGPCYEAQAGAALLVQKTGAPVYFVGAESEDCQTLDSWDRFILPAPCSRVKINLNRYRHPATKGGKDERAAIQEIIQEKLIRLTRDGHREARSD